MAFFMSDYYSIPTTLGAARLAAAANNGQALTLSHMAFGDANGVPYLPNSRVNAAALVNERYRIAVQYVVQDAQNPNVFIIKARIPASIGGFDVCEIGIFDTNGELIYLANYPRTSKPQITQGAGGELTIRIHVMTSHSSSLSIILDPHVITLTQAEGDNRYALKTELASETQSRINADDNEASIRASQDLALAISLAAEITNRTNSDNDLYQEIFDLATAFQNALNNESSIRANAITNITNYTFSAQQNGYYRLPNILGGFIFQWGFNNDTTNTNLEINFSIPFPNQCFGVWPSGHALSNSDRAEHITIEPIDNTKFRWYGAGGNPDGTISEPTKGWWFSIGY